MDTIKKYKVSFTQVPNTVLNDKNLSLKAKGLYAYLFSKPDGWAFHTPVILSEIKEKREAFYSAMKELVAFGYIVKYQLKEKGRFGGSVYEFTPPCAEKPYAENPQAGNQPPNNKYINNIYINNINGAMQEEKTGDYGDKIRIGADFKLIYDDEYFYPYRFANKKLTLSIEKWIIKNFLGQELDKGFICRQIGNFAKKQGCYMELLGVKED